MNAIEYKILAKIAKELSVSLSTLEREFGNVKDEVTRLADDGFIKVQTVGDDKVLTLTEAGYIAAHRRQTIAELGISAR